MIKKSDKLGTLWRTVMSAYQPRRHRDLLDAVWQQERWFDTPHQLAAANLMCDRLKEAGLSSAKLVPYAADGRTRYQDWRTRMAWDCPAATLSVAGSGEVLADRQTTPCATVSWSAPLGSKTMPVRAGVVCWDWLESPTSEDVNGKFVLTGDNAKTMKDRLAGMEPIAVISDHILTGDGYDVNTTQWVNTWGDGPNGWYFGADDRRMTGYVLSPEVGRRLRGMLRENPRLQLDAFCQSSVYEGQGHCVTAVLEGEDPSREVWLYGHACEQGASDNCSGASALIETMLMLNELVASGTLARPRHSIRMILTEECIGMLAFVTQHDELRKKALVGLNVDAVGDVSSKSRPFNLNFGPYANPTIGWVMCGLLGELAVQHNDNQYHLKPSYYTPSADDMIGDPGCGIPTMWLGHGKDACGYHSSSDTPEICDDTSLAANTQLAAAWAYAMASLNDHLAADFIASACRWMNRHIVHPPEFAQSRRLSQWAAANCLRDLKRWGVASSIYEEAASEYSPAFAPPLDELPGDGPRYTRRTWGTCTLNQLDPTRRAFGSPWHSAQNAALYWTNGRRGLSAVEKLVQAEVGSLPKGGLGPLYQLLCDADLVRIDLTSEPVAPVVTVGS